MLLLLLPEKMKASYRFPQQQQLPPVLPTMADAMLPPSPTDPPRQCDLHEIIGTVKRTLGTPTKLLHFSNVSPEVFSSIASKSRPSKSIKLSYHSTTGKLAIKMPGRIHEMVSGEFIRLVDRQIDYMGLCDEIVFLPSPLTTIGDWNKEPNASWSPRKTNQLTVVVEVGSSESTSHLASDARGWLETPGTPAQACITIDVREDKELVLEIWKLGPRIYQLPTRQSPAQAFVEQHVVLVNNGGEVGISGWRKIGDDRVHSDQLQLHIDLFLGRPAAFPEQDIFLSSPTLTKFASQFWKLLRNNTKQGQ